MESQVSSSLAPCRLLFVSISRLFTRGKGGRVKADCSLCLLILLQWYNTWPHCWWAAASGAMCWCPMWDSVNATSSRTQVLQVGLGLVSCNIVFNSFFSVQKFLFFKYKWYMSGGLIYFGFGFVLQVTGCIVWAFIKSQALQWLQQ